MVIYKFGGASVKNAEAFHFLKAIVADCSDQLIVVVSAMGKTTNGLEEIVKVASKGSSDYRKNLNRIREYHLSILEALIPERSDPVYREIDDQFNELESRIIRYKDQEFNLFYDQVVSLGEVVSTMIVSRFLNYQGIENVWTDIREMLVTDENYRDAAVDFESSADNILSAFDFKRANCYVTQGFIGSARNGNTTTLGREGSDFSAAILANICGAVSVVLWKDVEGIFSADPALFENVTLLPRISYQEMIELAYYGAKVIHPKTIKPLRKKRIPLYVRSFYNPEKKGSRISEIEEPDRKVPIIIIKEDQILVSISLEDLSFITENHISKLFGLLNTFRLKANLMQHSAVSFSVAVDKPRGKEVQELVDILRKEFRVLYNDRLILATIRHYSEESINDLISGKKIYVEQRSRNTVQYLYT